MFYTLLRVFVCRLARCSCVDLEHVGTQHRFHA